jgi:hypothetical protein
MRTVFGIAQTKFRYMILDIRAQGDALEATSRALQVSTPVYWLCFD